MLFEVGVMLGGYIVIVDVVMLQGIWVIDIGFIVYNDCIYLCFMGLFSELGIGG